jgi:hypothetical protein
MADSEKALKSEDIRSTEYCKVHADGRNKISGGRSGVRTEYLCGVGRRMPLEWKWNRKQERSLHSCTPYPVKYSVLLSLS